MIFLFTESSFVPDSEERFGYEELYSLCFRDVGNGADLTEQYLKKISGYFLSCILQTAGLELERDKLVLRYDEKELEMLASAAPPAIGQEYVNASWVRIQLDALLEIYRKEISAFPGSVDLYFNGKIKALSIPGRIYFHLVVNNLDPEFPFSFMATYSSKDDDGYIHHYPLGYARTQYDEQDERFKALLMPISKAARSSKLAKDLMESGNLFRPVMLSSKEAEQFLNDSELFTDSGIVCRVPDFWRRKGKSTSISVRLKDQPNLGLEKLISIVPSLTYDGVEVTREDIIKLLSETSGLAFLKGKWVVLDKNKLQELLKASESLGESLEPQDLMGYSSGLKDFPVPLRLPEENWLGNLITKATSALKEPEGLTAILRPYQKDGYKYLTGMRDAGFGICLADDMGLGKTVQVLAFLEMLREESKASRVLLVVPATLIGNWHDEIIRFTPNLDFHTFHGTKRLITDSFLTITTYGVVAKDETLAKIEWDAVILDEAQYIKNATTKVFKSLRSLRRKQGICLTGTPVENNLMNLWSIMDFVNPGFLGTRTEFSRYAKSLELDQLSHLRSSVAPFILRRLKSDKRIIDDLPDKVETDLSVTLTKQQIVLYRKVVADTERAMLEERSEFEAKGLVLQSIMKLKQVCNHPDQYLGLENYKSSESGKFELLSELCSTIRDNREKVLVFTQFKEIIPALDRLLYLVFGIHGLTIDGSVPAKRRSEIVDEFQKGRAPYLVLSLRAAGVGLNLTAARNVIHFDRWWNPAVENQATDRAYRIGQRHKVMVYKFVSRDTIEEEINKLIQSKQELSDALLSDLSSDIFSKLSPKEIVSAMKFKGGL